MQSLKEIALSFERLVISGQIREAYDKHISPTFIHHNPWFKGDRASLLRGMEDNAARSPDKGYRVQRALEDGDLVVIHARIQPSPTMSEMSVVHIYRFAGDKIVEEWDLGQPLPDNSPNENGLF